MGIHNNALIGASSQGYKISRSVRLRNSATGYFTRVAGTPTSQNVWTISMWVKLGNMMASNGTPNGCFFGANQAGNPNESIKWNGPAESGASQIYYQSSTAGGTHNLTRFISNNFRDPSAWYHLVFQKNASAASGTGCFLAWVNGVSVTFTGGYTGTQASVPNYINTTGSTFNIGAIGTANSLDAYLAEINFVDGQALTPSSFGETNSITGVWQPKKYTGTYGNNGFYLNFNDNSAATAAAIGKDSSGNGNNLTPSAGISVTAGATYDSMLDTPTPYADGGNGRGNYCTLNPLYKGTNVTPTQGNLKFGMVSGNFHEGITGTIFPTSGKWYAEFLWNAVTANTTATAVCRNNAAMNNTTCAFQNTVDTNSPTYRSYIVNGNKDTNTTTAAYGSTYTANDTIGVALDLDNGKVWFSKNGVWQASGDPAAGTNAAFTDITGADGWTFGVSGYGSGGDNCHANFGQQPFTYTPPTGFKALNTQNLPTPTISNGATVMAATTYTGNGSTQTINNSANGVSFAPDFVWVKVRSAGATDHYLADTVRGATKYLQSDTTAAEGTNNGITAFNSNGFSVGAIGDTNTNAASIVGWQWNAGGSTVTNTDGSISSQVRANPTAGFSIVTYTGTGSGGSATVGHGLGVQPSMVILKSRTVAGQNWGVAHVSIPNSRIALQSTAAATTGGGTYGEINYQSTFTSSVIKFLAGSTNSDAVNGSGQTYVAYCFAAVAGYSAFGSYTGNGSTDGPFVYLGFRPRFLLVKAYSSGSAERWLIWDSSRDTYNIVSLDLVPNTTAAEGGALAALDFLSNGFKIRTANSSAYNFNGYSYIYAAFAENPFKNSLAR